MKTIVVKERQVRVSDDGVVHAIVRPAVGSPYYIDPRTGLPVFISPPGTRPATSEDVYRELEDFP